MHRFSFVVAALGLAALPLTAHAITVDCSDATGMCTLSNDGFDQLSCECADGEGIGGGGGNMWAGYTEEQLTAECIDWLDSFCGEPVPPVGGVSCETMEGFCTVANEPEDYASCECASGKGGAFGGGNAWADLDDDQLLEVCIGVAAKLCGGEPPPPAGVVCETRDGMCMVDNDPVDSFQCACANGSEPGGGGGNAWAGLDAEGLYDACVQTAADVCADDPGETEGTSETGDADTGDDVIDTDGPSSTDDAGTGSGTDTGSDDAGSDTDGPATDGGDASASDGDASASAGDASASDASAGDASAGSDETGGESAGASDDGEGCSCSADGSRKGPLALAMGLLLGWRSRRRR